MRGTADVGAGRYQLGELLGKGGMGTVHRAIDRKSGQTIALKRLTVQDDDKRHARMVDLFHQEYRTLSQLAHPRVVSVYDFGIDEQGPYYTMELLEGTDAHKLAPLPWAEACALLRDVCSAVALLHSRRLLHRDLSPKNIRRMADGRAKLLDFGAMTPMGPVKAIIGTPPLVPPEALMQQSLDARADLYALGATLYYVLTGVHAFAARRFEELHALWRYPPRAPSERVPGIPRELDALVLSLLSTDLMARPRSAAEVLDRLAAIASLPDDAQLAVRSAYLSTPEIVGRDAQVAQVRARLRELHTGRGGALLITGARGMGCSRVLEATVLDAKLSGVRVVRTTAADARGGDYGMLTELVRELSDALPAIDTPALGNVRPLWLVHEGNFDAVADRKWRPALHAVLGRWLRTLSIDQPLMLAIDDFERCDEPSQAAVAALVAACRRSRLLCTVTCASDTGRADGTALALLREDGDELRIEPLTLEQTEQLLGSVFGEVPNLSPLAVRIHERSNGSPYACMQIAQYLVERGVVQYERGSWTLPSDFDEAAFPSSLSDARRGRLEGLSDDARELAEALAIAEWSGLDREVYPELTSHGAAERVGAALEELLAAGILRSEGAQFAFEGPLWAGELRDAADAERGYAICARVADALERRGRDRLEIARYRHRAGQIDAMLEALLTELAVGSRWDRCPRDYATLLQAGIDACKTSRRSPRDWFALQRELVKVGHDLSVAGMRERLAALFQQLRKDTGLDVWETLDPDMPAPERLQKAFEAAQARHDAAPEHERGLAPMDAILTLTWLTVDTSSLAAQTGDWALFDTLLPMTAFKPLSPAIARVEELTVPACRAIVAGRYEEAVAMHTRSLEQVDRPDYADSDPETREWTRRALHYALGCLEAGLGREKALDHAEYLENAPGWRVPAIAVRRIYHGTLGNLREAERCRKNIELSLLQSAVTPPLSAGAAHQHVYIAALCDDLTGFRHTIPEMEILARVHPSLEAFVAFARADHARICGDHAEALRLCEHVLANVRPGEHPLWPWAAGTLLSALIGEGRVAEAVEVGMRHSAVADTLGLGVMKDHIEIPLAVAQARMGDAEQARTRIDAIIARRQAEGMEGAVLGWAYETRARVALLSGDGPGFDHYAELCALQYKKSGGNPALAAKYERLMQEARQAGLRLRAELAEAIGRPVTIRSTMHTTIEREAIEVAHAFADCTSADERARRALDLLMERSGACEVHLFVLRDSGLVLVASSRTSHVDEEVLSAVERLADTSWQEEETKIASQAVTQAIEAPDKVWPLLLSRLGGTEPQVVGVAALRFDDGTAVKLPMHTATAIASALAAAGDAVPRAL